MTDDGDFNPMQEALDSVPNASKVVAKELRMMAAGEDRYQRFTYISPWIKNIWNAAADIIEDYERQKLH
ncbi:MAG TPA: hypothetical protein DEA55_01790 [Rhodospirillaceae bacterium]|nr:hypothetical protein [Rhodospirillaceae bacterium]